MSNFRTTSLKEGGEPFVLATIKKEMQNYGRKIGEQIKVSIDKFKGEVDKFQVYSFEGFNNKTLTFKSGSQSEIEEYFDFEPKVEVVK